MDRYSREYLVGLRGKDRAKMTYAIEQADIEMDHTMALFDEHARTIRPTLENFLEVNNAQITEATEKITALIDGLYTGLAPILAPYTVHDRHQFPPGYHAHTETVRNVLDAAAWMLETKTRSAIRQSLFDYRRSLTASPKVAKNLLTPKEMAEIVKAVSTVKALPANVTPNAAGEIEV